MSHNYLKYYWKKMTRNPDLPSWSKLLLWPIFKHRMIFKEMKMSENCSICGFRKICGALSTFHVNLLNWSKLPNFKTQRIDFWNSNWKGLGIEKFLKMYILPEIVRSRKNSVNWGVESLVNSPCLLNELLTYWWVAWPKNFCFV